MRKQLSLMGQYARVSDNFFADDRVHGESLRTDVGSDGILNFPFHQTEPDKIIVDRAR